MQEEEFRGTDDYKYCSGGQCAACKAVKGYLFPPDCRAHFSTSLFLAIIAVASSLSAAHTGRSKPWRRCSTCSRSPLCQLVGSDQFSQHAADHLGCHRTDIQLHTATKQTEPQRRCYGSEGSTRSGERLTLCLGRLGLRPERPTGLSSVSGHQPHERLRATRGNGQSRPLM